MARFRLSRVWVALLVLFVALELLLLSRAGFSSYSFGPHLEPWSAVAGRFREELTKRLPKEIDLYEAALEMARSASPRTRGRSYTTFVLSLPVALLIWLSQWVHRRPSSFRSIVGNSFFPRRCSLVQRINVRSAQMH